jgi:spore germination protein KB
LIREGKFGLSEAICLITVVNANKVLFTSPSHIVRLVGTAGWYMTLISAAVAAVGFTFVYLLVKRFAGRDIVEVFNIVLGPFVGLIVSAAFAALFMFNAGITMGEFTEVFKVYVLPESPKYFIVLIFIIPVVIINYLGLETLARIARISAYFLLAGFIAVLVLGFQNYNFYRLFPLEGRGIGKTLYHGLARSSVYADAVILAVIARTLQKTNNIKKAGYAGIAISGLLISAALMAFSLAFNYHTGAEITSPMYQMTTLIDYGRFIQRIDPIFLLTWNVSSFISVSLLFYAAVSIYCKMFEMHDTRPVIIALSTVLFATAMLPENISSVSAGFIQKIREYGWILYHIPPLITLAIAVLRKKGSKKVCVG